MKSPLPPLLLGYSIFNVALVLSLILPSIIDSAYANFIVLALFLVASTLSSKISLNKLSVICILTSIVLYSVNQGALKFLVPILPFLGFIFTIKPFKPDCYDKFAIWISSSAIVFINIYSHFAVDKLGLNFINLQSEIYLYIILVNLIYFRKPFSLPVLLAVANSLLFSPGLIGNRSALFLLIFLFNREYITHLVTLLRSKSLGSIGLLFCLFMLLFLFLNILIANPKWGDDYYEPRFDWLLQILGYVHTHGLEELWKYAEILLPSANPHNSYLYLLMYETLVGIFKIIIFISSIFIIPGSAFFAIFFRAFFDSFFLVGPSGLIFFILIRSYKRYGIT